MALPTPKEIAGTLIECHQSASSKANPQPLLLLTPQQVRKLSGRKLLRGTVLASIEGILRRKQMYFFSNHELFLLAPFGALTRARSKHIAG